MVNQRRVVHGVNFITAHDGFALWDLVSYHKKRNEANGENSRDGSNDNFSWNCGVEGETSDPKVLALRQRQARNMMTILLLSRGTPMIVAGDELLHTRGGNNNWYGHDQPFTWFDWDVYTNGQEKGGDPGGASKKVGVVTDTETETETETENETVAAGKDQPEATASTSSTAVVPNPGKDFHRFVKHMIAFRKQHPLLGRDAFLRPEDVTWHENNWENTESKYLQFTLHSKSGEGSLLVMINAHHYLVEALLPAAPTGTAWRRVVDTYLPSPRDFTVGGGRALRDGAYGVQPYSSVVLIARKDEGAEKN